VFAFVCLLLFHIYILYMLHITQTDRQTDIDRSIDLCLFSLSLSLSLYTYSCFLLPAHSHTTTTRLAPCACMCVCAFGSLSSNASDVPITGHIMIIIMPRTNNRRTPRHSNTPRHALLGAGHGVLCVCIGVSCCEAAVRGGRVEIRAVPPPPPACCHKTRRQTCRRRARTLPPS